jgi:hypothetical protein
VLHVGVPTESTGLTNVWDPHSYLTKLLF